MSERVQRIIGKIKSFRWILNGIAKPSFSQVGEDSILGYLFQSAGIKNPTYLEIGTNHPIVGNNTYAFYLRGSRGVLVEPDPALQGMIKKYRPKDVLLECGIALQETESATFYVFPSRYTGWNTFSEEEVTVRKNAGIGYEKSMQVPLLNINNVIKNNFSEVPDFIGIDVEGLDEEIIRSLDFELYGPKVICIETLRFGQSDVSEKQDTIIQFLHDKGYVLYADTFVNSIFCKASLIK